MRNLYRLNHEMSEMAKAAIEFEIEAGNIVNVESTKLERKLRDALNRICKLVPSIRRVSELNRIAAELDTEADKIKRYDPPTVGADPAGLEADALYLRRLEYDLTSMREAKASLAPRKISEAPMRAASKYESTQWPRGERP